MRGFAIVAILFLAAFPLAVRVVEMFT